MERAFRDTYGFEVNQIMIHEDLAISTYRHSVSGLLPKMTKVAVVQHQKELNSRILASCPGNLSIVWIDSHNAVNYGSEYQKPGPGAEILVFFLRILPKIEHLRHSS